MKYLDPKHIISILGKPFESDEVQLVLTALDIRQKPKIKKGENTAYVVNTEAGVEFALSDAETIGHKESDTPEGTLFITNVRTVCMNHGGTRAYPFDLPLGLNPKASLAQIQAKLGKFAWGDENLGGYRWDVGYCSVFAKFVDDVLLDYGFQIPNF